MLKFPKGETIEDPRYPFDIYGNGRKWVIQQDKIWQITNNGMDGDNWGLNNIATGGAGAIGVYLPYSQELRNLITKEELVKVNKLNKKPTFTKSVFYYLKSCFVQLFSKFAESGDVFLSSGRFFVYKL